MHIITPMPDMEWIQDHAYQTYKALGLGRVDVQIMRTEDDALVQVVLQQQINAKGQSAVSVFRFKNGYGIRDNIKRAFRMAAKELEDKIAREKAKMN